MLRRLGVSQEAIDEMDASGSGAEFDERESAALAFAEAMTLNPRAVPEEVWRGMNACYDDGEIVEIAAVVAVFNGFNRFNDALEVEVTT